jgi:thiol-disulfide isomerase/thioredoxin
VKPQDSIFIKVTDLEKVAFSGKGAYENQILYEFQKQFNFEDITNQLLYSPQKPKSYLDLKKQIDLIYEAQINFLKIANLKRQLDKNFEDWITLEINYFLQNNILTCHLENKIFDESILNKGLLISNLPQSLQLKSNQYNSFIIKYLEYLNMIETKKNNKNLDKHHKLIAARELLHNSAILNYIEVQLVLDLLKNYSNSRIIESEYQIVKQKIKDKILADYFEEIYQKSIATLVGKLCPNFTLNNNLGKVISSKDFNGKVIVLDFWASWCKPCIESLDKLKKIQNQYKNVSFVLISIDKNKQEWLKAIDKYELNEFTNLIAEENLGFKSPMAQKFGLKYIPTTFIIDKNQVIVANEISEASGEEWKIILNKTIELNK